MPNHNLRPSLRFVFAKPCIEAIFWEFPEVVSKAIKKIAGYSGVSINEVKVPTVTSDFECQLKSLCRQHQIRYKKGEFAEHFFGILGRDFVSSVTLRRFEILLRKGITMR